MSLKRHVFSALCMMIFAYGADVDNQFQQTQKDLSLLEEIKALQKNAKRVYGLSELLKAADSNYSLQAKVLSSLQAKKNLLTQKMTFLPQLNIDYGFQHNARNTQMFDNFFTQAADAKFSWNLFSGFSTINGIKEKNSTYLANLSDEEYTRQSIYLQVVQQYYGYFDNISKLISLQKKLSQIQAEVLRVQRLFNQGLTTIDNLEALKAQAAQSQYQIDSAKLNVEQNRLNLQFLTNLNIEALNYDRLQNPEYKLEERADITSMRHQIDAQIYQNKQLNYLPSIDVSNTFTYNIQRPEYVNLNPSFTNMYPVLQNVAGISVTWKLFDNIGIALQKQSLRIGQMASQKNFYYKKMEQKRDEQLYRKTLQIAILQIKSAAANLKSADLAYLNVKKKYNANLINYVDYLQALSTKFDAEATFNQSVNNFEVQKANYIFYSGQKIKDYLEEKK